MIDGEPVVKGIDGEEIRRRVNEKLKDVKYAPGWPEAQKVQGLLETVVEVLPDVIRDIINETRPAPSHIPPRQPIGCPGCGGQVGGISKARMEELGRKHPFCIRCGREPIEYIKAQAGEELRDKIAIAAMQGFVSDSVTLASARKAAKDAGAVEPGLDRVTDGILSKSAYQLADKMIEAREGGKAIHPSNGEVMRCMDCGTGMAWKRDGRKWAAWCDKCDKGFAVVDDAEDGGTDEKAE
jgi:hypothetical protein